jgi:hypothetical protein
MHSEIFLQHPNLLIQAHLLGKKQGEIVANFLLYAPKMLNPQKFWGPLSSSDAPLSSDREIFSEIYATNSCETYILYAMLCSRSSCKFTVPYALCAHSLRSSIPLHHFHFIATFE